MAVDGRRSREEYRQLFHWLSHYHRPLRKPTASGFARAEELLKAVSPCSADHLHHLAATIDWWNATRAGHAPALAAHAKLLRWQAEEQSRLHDIDVLRAKVSASMASHFSVRQRSTLTDWARPAAWVVPERPPEPALVDSFFMAVLAYALVEHGGARSGRAYRALGALAHPPCSEASARGRIKSFRDFAAYVVEAFAAPSVYWDEDEWDRRMRLDRD